MSGENIVTEMDTDETLSSIMSDLAIGSSTKIEVNTLVMLNISDHWTRATAQHGEDTQVFGALLGTKEKTNIRVTNSFELKMNKTDDNVIIDCDYISSKLDQYKQIFDDESIVVGWYTTGKSPTQKDEAVHKQMFLINEWAIMLKLNPCLTVSKENRVKFYEATFDVENKEIVCFLPLSYNIIVDNIDHMMNEKFQAPNIKNQEEHSSTEKSLMLMHSSVTVLLKNIKLILLYLEDVESGKLSKNQQILRDLKQICDNLPVLKNSEIENYIKNGLSEAGYGIFLMILVQACSQFRSFFSKYNALFERKDKTKKK